MEWVLLLIRMVDCSLAIERGEAFGPITRGDNPPPVYASGLGAVADIAFDEAGYLYYACND